GASTGGAAGGAGGANAAGASGKGGASAGGASGGGGAGGGPTKPFCAVPPTLKEAGACTGRPIGTALAASHLSESAYATAAKEFNLATPENEMKWDATEPTKGNFTFGAADQIVSFAKTNGMKVKGHTLVWHMQLPSWVQNLSNAADVRSAMVNHITGVMNHFKSGGVVTAWDVVNEAWENDGSKLRDSPFSRQLGAGFIDEAFAAAHAADPNAKLYYNDFRADGMNAKSESIYMMLKGMVERKVPINGLGLQMHEGTPNPYPKVSEIAQNMQRIADLGLEILVSEMDAHVCDGMTSQQQTAWYHDVVAACVAQPKCTAITFWGTTDKYSWLSSFTETNCNGKDPSGCLWDNNYTKKPAYTGVMNALTGR
ncbi:MAG TPA: endo-1,4-beta-xylanase, partial [Polyangia bacterium]|nr:endo-1,4-beta-xylanase [Polyangia bacterium]